jgi:ABC-2 type transport system ATP-binding protein
MTEPAIDIEQLVKTYNAVTAVDRLSLQVQQGEIFGLLGPNGAGKTTTIRILMDILKPDSGQVRVLGKPPGAARLRVGYLPEERGLYRNLKVEECLIYLGELKGLARSEARTRVKDLLARVELEEWARRKVQDLSRGMQQKVQIIASLIHDPDLVILDEPFQGLDPVNVEMVTTMIRDVRSRGKTVVLSAHEMSLVESLCERIALIDRGQIVLNGRLADIKKQFAPNALEISPALDLAGWPEVKQVESRDGRQRVYLADGVAPRDLLLKIFREELPIERFELASMPLDQIFVTVMRRGGPHD